MLVSYNDKFFYRSIVRFYSKDERLAIVNHLANIAGKVFIEDNKEFPFPSENPVEPYGVLIADFDKIADRDNFELFLTPDKRLGTEQRERSVRQLPKEVVEFDSALDLTKTKTAGGRKPFSLPDLGRAA